MKKVFHFDSPRDRYVCDAAVLWCFDDRFAVGFRKFLKDKGILRSDHIKIAGGAKSLSSPAKEGDREFVLDQIRTSIRLHQTPRIILMAHSDCGAYGGLPEVFRGDVQAEADHLKEELRRAAATIAAAIPGLDVEGYFIDFEGVWDAEIKSNSQHQAIA